jgi:hypothetical protein
MARTVDQILRSQLGNLLVEIAMLTAQVEDLQEKLAAAQEKPKEKEVVE